MSFSPSRSSNIQLQIIRRIWRMVCVGHPKMQYVGSNRLLALLLSLAASCGAFGQSSREPVTAYVEADKASVLVFLPPSIEDPRGRGAAAAQANAASAIENTKTCLGKDYASYRVVFAERIVVRSAGREEVFEVGHFSPLAGALLLRHGSNVRILFAGGGPEALTQMLRLAASEYFGKRCDG